MTFSDLERIVSQWQRLENGCYIWHGTENSQGSAVININGRCRTVKSVIAELLYTSGNRPTREVCHTERCIHPRHVAMHRINQLA